MDIAAAVFSGFAGIVSQVLGFFAILGVMVTSGILELAVRNLNYILSPSFINLSYTNPANNPFIAMGWELTRGLTNIIFVLALIAIGIGTILGRADFHAKKALPLLIAIALLINFTPLILGLIVDATNILMNQFLGAGFVGGEIFTNNMKSAWQLWWGSWGNQFFFNPTSGIGTFLGILSLSFFNILSSFILFIFAAVFTVRYIAIWILVILSPLAFACYILPATRNFWKEWWTQFIQWSIIGVVASFFLYLANQMIKMIFDNKDTIFSLGKAGADNTGIFDTVLPWGIAIGFLFYGLMMTFKTSAMGADRVIKGFDRGLKAAGKVAGTTSAKLGWKGVKGMGEDIKQARADYRSARNMGFNRTESLAGAARLTWSRKTEGIRESYREASADVRAAGGWRGSRAGAATAGIAAAVGTAISPPAVRGIASAVKDSVKAGAMAGLNIKKKKKKDKPKATTPKGLATCPTCKREIAADADPCPRCGTKFS